MIYKPFDVVVVPFPFTDVSMQKKRPALVLSSKENFNLQTKHCVLAMITSAQNSPWALDYYIKTIEETGLHTPSVVRMKIFTLDIKLIIKKIGKLSEQDQKSLQKNIELLLFTQPH